MNSQTTKYPRILIVGTTPYSPDMSSRALDTYFGGFPNEKLRMIYSVPVKPMKGHCESFYQITDQDVFNRLKKPKSKCGRMFYCSELCETQTIQKNSLSKFKKRTSLRYYARKILWNKKRWLTQELADWVEEFKPEAVYICFSDDYFILDIADYFITKYKIPVIAQIGDDYFFKKYPLIMNGYLKKYKKLFTKIMSNNGFGVYISDKIAEKYNSYFKLQGVPFYLQSKINNIEQDIKYAFNYIGKIGLGRDNSLKYLGKLLHKVDSDFELDIYSQDKVSNSKIKKLASSHCVFKGPIDYQEAERIMNSGAFNVIASGFREKDINETRFSLSTKVSDLLASSGPIIAIGGKGDGAIDFFKKNECAIILDEIPAGINAFKAQLLDKKLLRENIKKANLLSKNMFSIEKNRGKFELMCQNLVGEQNE